MSLVRRFGLCVAFSLTVLVQHPVSPNETSALTDGAIGETIIARAGRVVIDCKPPEVTEATTVFDERAKVWKRYFTESTKTAVGNRVVVKVAVSRDNKEWTALDEPCFSPSTDLDEWDHSSVATPTIVYSQTASPDRRFMMWYVGKNDRMRHKDQFNQTNIGLAISGDGLTFKRLSATESPYSSEGLVLIGKGAFPEAEMVSEGCLADPHVSCNVDAFELTFSKVGRTASGALTAAGISQAQSNDGVHWSVDNQAALSLECVGSNPSASTIINRLKRLATAYSEVGAL